MFAGSIRATNIELKCNLQHCLATAASATGEVEPTASADALAHICHFLILHKFLPVIILTEHFQNVCLTKFTWIAQLEWPKVKKISKKKKKDLHLHNPANGYNNMSKIWKCWLPKLNVTDTNTADIFRTPSF